MLINRSTILLFNLNNCNAKLKSIKLINQFKNDCLIRCTVFSRRSLCKSVQSDQDRNESKLNDKSNDKSSIKQLKITSSNDESKKEVLYPAAVLKG